jgi:hypothetical protein
LIEVKQYSFPPVLFKFARITRIPQPWSDTTGQLIKNRADITCGSDNINVYIRGLIIPIIFLKYNQN